MAADPRRIWRRIWRNARHPKVREERVKALSTLCGGAGLALIVGALAGPILNPAQQQDWVLRAALALGGGALILAAQVLLGYIAEEDNHD
ncbi:MAG: hypothetical protein JNJ73_18350 [Hyphomonadaceae bacterium]|nr:hypothetical protein [Hyphomonadaceae bacterium]